jgi:hypothetical protein
MADNANRQSLNISLAERYSSQHVGGAYDAKGPQPDVLGIQETFWTKKGFVAAIGEKLGTGGTKKIEQSLYRQSGVINQFNNNKYKP